MQDLRLQLFKLRNKKKMLNPFEPVGTVLIVFSNNLLRANLHIMVYDQMPGAPNENIVQNHLNIALLNIF